MGWKRYQPDEQEQLLQDVFDEIDEEIAEKKKAKAEKKGKHKKSDDEDDEKLVRYMIRLDDFDATISLFGIECIEKKMRFVETPKPRWQFGIAINGGMEPSMRYPKTDLYAWYEKEEVRDRRYEEILTRLNEYGIITLKA